MRKQRYIVTDRDSVYVGQFTHLQATGVVEHGFSTRRGGVSEGPYRSLNLGLKTGDDPGKVRENRRRFIESLELDYSKVVMSGQIHGDTIAVVTGDSHTAGKSLPGTDALITNVPEVPLLLFYADCVPVYIVDPVKRAVGLAHAGWKGTVLKIAQKTIQKMAQVFGTNPADCLAAIAPSIGPCCYQVDRVVIDPLCLAFPYWQEMVRPWGEDKWLLDLWQANCRQLEDIGVKTENIVTSGVCTACNTDLYYSHRAEHGCTGRMGAVIALR